MKKSEYHLFEARVRAFFESEGITNLTRKDNDSEPYFSKSSCDCCGTHLGGDRIEATGYNPESREVQDYEICSDCEYYAEYGVLDDQTMLDMEDDQVRLSNIEGIARLSGIDEHGNHWTQFDVDYFADQEEGECSICGAILVSGWLCLDGGEEVCSDHVVYREE